MNNLIEEKNHWNENSILWPFMEKKIPEALNFISPIINKCTISHKTHIYHHMIETMEHKLHRMKQVLLLAHEI